MSVIVLLQSLYYAILGASRCTLEMFLLLCVILLSEDC